MKLSQGFLVTLLCLWWGLSSAQDVTVNQLSEMPEIDGNYREWQVIEPVVIKLHKTKEDGTVELDQLLLKMGRYHDRLYVYVEWKDESRDTVHKPWVWDNEEKKYVRGPQREDRLALQFAMSDNYTTNWRSGNEFSADTWHWKASRSNPLGLAHDKSLKITRYKQLRSSKLKLQDGSHIYITRPSDKGKKLYKTKRYSRFKNPEMPKYILQDDVSGSVADVKASGVWKDGKWQLEMSRLLSTGHEDDVNLPDGKASIKGGLAVFNHSENDDHAISRTLTFHFPAK